MFGKSIYVAVDIRSNKVQTGIQTGFPNPFLDYGLDEKRAFYETKKKTLDNYFNNNYDDTIDFVYDVLVRDIGLEYELRQTV